jgi:hypothetical protein
LLKSGFVTSSVRRWRGANCRFKFQKRRQLFIGMYNETLSVAMRVSNPDYSPLQLFWTNEDRRNT